MNQADMYIEHAGRKIGSLVAGVIGTTVPDWQQMFGLAGTIVGVCAGVLTCIYSLMLIQELRRKRKARETRDLVNEYRESERDTLR